MKRLTTLALLATTLVAGLAARADAAPACSTVAQLTDTVGGNTGNPAVDADGDRIAFRSTKDLTGDNADGSFEVFLLDRTAHTLTQLTDTSGSHGVQAPAISDDGTRITFGSDADLTGDNADLGEEIFVYDTTTSTLSQRTDGATDTDGSEDPDISGNGQFVVFSSIADLTGGDADHSGEVYRVNAVGIPTVTKLTSSGALSSFNPAAGQTGARIAFVSTADLVPATGNADGNREIFVTEPAGPVTVQLTDTTGDQLNVSPVLTDDGSRVFFASQQDLTGANPDHDFQVFRRVITGATTQITHIAGGAASSPSTDATGGRLAFQSDALDLPGNTAGSTDVYVTDLTPTGISGLTDVPVGKASNSSQLSDDGEVITFGSSGDLLGTNPDQNGEIFLARCGAKTPVFTDVPKTNAAFGPIQWLAELGITTVPANHRYSPAADLQRRQAATFLYNLAGRPAFAPPGTASFSDVAVGSAGFKQVEWLVSEGIVTVPGNHRFAPTAALKRNQLAQMLFRLAGEPLFVPPGSATFTDVPIGNPFRIPVEWLAAEGIVPVPANHRFRPTEAVTRQSVATILHNFAVRAVIDLD